MAGILFSPALLGGMLGLSIGGWSEPLTSVAMGIIAYLIGGSITVDQLRRRRIAGIRGLSTGGAEPMDGYSENSSGACLRCHRRIPTAPAATVAVLHQYHAKGPLSTTLFGVVALDDALGIILFALMLVVTAGTSLTASLGTALLEVAGSIAVGVAAGYGLSRLARHLHQGGIRLPLVLAAILLVLGIAETSGLSMVTETGSIAGHLSHKKMAHLLLAEHRPIHTRRQLMERVASETMDKLMDTHFVFAYPDEELDNVLHRQSEHEIEDMPVIDDQGAVLGVINLSAVLREMRREDECRTSGKP